MPSQIMGHSSSREAMLLKDFERTQQRYVDAVAGLAKFYERAPDTLGDEEVQRYLLHLRQARGLSASTTNVTLHALRCFFHKTLRRRRSPPSNPRTTPSHRTASMMNAHERVPARTGHVQGDHSGSLAHGSQIGRKLNASAHSPSAERPPNRFADPALPRRTPLAHAANPSPLTGESMQSP